MSLYNRPQKRLKSSPIESAGEPVKGSFLYEIITNKPIEYFVKPILPVYKQADYLKMIEKNCKNLGIPFVDPQLPVHVHNPPPPKTKEPVLDYLDKVYVNFKILKSGTVRIKVVPNFLILFENYYKHAKKPPMKLIIQAYKAVGFSDKFLEHIKKSEEERLQFAKKVPTILQKIFDKEPVKKVKRVVKKKEIEEEEPEVEQVIEEEAPVDGAMDVEVDPDDDEEVEEDYVSDED